MTSPAPWVRVVRYAALAIAMWSVALQSIAGELIPPVAIYGIVFLSFVPFLRDDRRRLAGIVGGLALVSILANLPMTIDELSHPSSAPAFILTLLATTAGAVAIIGGFAALTRRATTSIRGLVMSATAVMIGGVALALVAAASVEAAEPLPSDFKVIATGVEFEPTSITVEAGEVGFWVDNQDGIRHTFTIEGTPLEIDVPGLSAQRADFVLEPGRYTVFCRVPGHENMKIDLIVEG